MQEEIVRECGPARRGVGAICIPADRAPARRQLSLQDLLLDCSRRAVRHDLCSSTPRRRVRGYLSNAQQTSLPAQLLWGAATGDLAYNYGVKLQLYAQGQKKAVVKMERGLAACVRH